jgi:hypothetical protein
MYKALAGVLAALLLALGGCQRPDLVGTWMGHDPHGVSVSYSFGPDGTGYRRTATGPREPLAYELRLGYPNLIDVVTRRGDATQVQHGIVQIASQSEMRLELSPPGEQAPRQLSDAALSLRKPATR